MNEVCGIYKLFDKKDMRMSQRIQPTILQVISDMNQGRR